MPIQAQTPAPGTPGAALSQGERTQAIASLAPRYRNWLQGVIGLISQAELDYFLNLDEDFRRDAFMEAFWKPRDPDPRTPENELFSRWQELGGGNGQGLAFNDPRLLLYLFNGPPGGWSLPDGRPVSRCFSRQRQIEIWFYETSERIDRRFPVVLLRRSTERPFQVYLPGENLRAVQHTDRLPTTDIRLLCADELLRYTFAEMDRIPGYDDILKQALAPPLPSAEWLATFSGSDAEPPAEAQLFEVDMDLGFPARNQSRTTLQVMLGVSRDVAPGKVFDGELFHHFLLIGEVIRDGRRLETFRYRFEGPTPAADADGSSGPPIAIGFSRDLRPGKINLRLLLHDVFNDTYAHIIEDLDVPSPEGLPALAVVTEQRAQGPSLELSTPSGRLHTGPVRFRARARGELDKVTFYLNDEAKLSKRKPPYSVELDLGQEPLPQRVRVVGFVDDQPVATDQIWLNQGPQRFRVGFVEPQSGGIYPGGFVARIDVTTPDGRPPAKLDLYLGDTLFKTLVEGPYAQPIKLPNAQPTLIRAVAYLADGSQAEDAVIVNSSPLSETVDVRLVELPVVVTDRSGQAIGGLTREQFQLVERLGDRQVPRPIERLIPGSESPLSAALLIDRSASMEPHLPTVRQAAATFAQAALDGAEDRMAVFSFAERLRVDTDLTPQGATVERALAGLQPGGRTAFYDSLVESLQSLGDRGGPAVLVLFTDGQDEASRLTFDQARDALQRSGVGLYSIALASAFPSKKERQPLEELAAASGGRAEFLSDLGDLDQVYADIAAELRSRYLVTFKPSITAAGEDDGGYRRLRLEVDVDGADVRTRPGYIP